jgi:hypothetical protein
MRFDKRIPRLLCLLAFLVILPTGHTEERKGWHLEHRVPASVLGMVSLEDVGGWEARFQKTALSGIWRDPEMKAFMQPILDGLEEMLASDEEGPLGEYSELVHGALKQLEGLEGQVSVAIYDVDMEDGIPQGVASLDFGPNVGAFAEFLERMRAKLDPDSEVVKKFKRDGRTWWQLQKRMPLTATTFDTAFVIATDVTLLEGVMAGTVEHSMGASADYQTVHGRAGGEELAVFAYANVPAISDLLMPKLEEEQRKMANALGLDTVKAAAYGMAFRGDGFMDSMILHAPAATHGIVPVLKMPAFQPRALPYVPANAFWYEEGACNYNEMVPNLRRLAKAVDEEMAAEMDRWLQKSSDAVGVDLEKDVLGGLAGGAASYMAMPQTGGLYPELAMMMQVSDPAAYEQVFQRFARGVAGMLSEEAGILASTREMEYRGHRLHLFEMQAARGDDVIPFTPTWTMIDDWMVITLVPHAMKEIILRAQMPETGGGLAAQEDFRTLQDVLPEGAGAMSYFDLQAVLNLLYDTAVPLLQTAVKPNMLGDAVPFAMDWAQLPAARTVRPFLRSLGVFSTWNADGISIQVHSPLPMVGLLAPLAGVAVPFLMVGRTTSRQSLMIELESPLPGGPPQIDPRMPEPKDPRLDGPEVVGMGPEARQAHADARMLSSYVRAFLLSEKRLPTGLDELVEQDILSSLPRDPWGNSYALRVTNGKTRRFQITSAGPDGVWGTDDDIAVGR